MVDQHCELSFGQQCEQLCSLSEGRGTFMIKILVLSASPAASILGASGANADPDKCQPPAPSGIPGPYDIDPVTALPAASKFQHL
jgi:hypothetical protein